MTRTQVQSAIDRGAPFFLRMADGKEYEVPHPDYISLAPTGTFVTVYDDEGRFYVLPLITMTGHTSTVSETNAGAEG